MKSVEDRLGEFQTQNNIATKGPLSLVIQFTRLVRDKEFPLNHKVIFDYLFKSSYMPV